MLKRILKDRTANVLIISALLALLVAWLRPPFTDPLLRTQAGWNRFWAEKTHATLEAHDLILLGDSRLYRGVSPEAMQRQLPGLSILNFGYSSGGLNTEIFAEADKRLKDSGIVVLAITPWSLTESACRNEHFHEELYRPRWERFERRYLGPLVQGFAPFPPAEIYRQLRGEQPAQRYTQQFHPGGWVASDKQPGDPAEALPQYRSELQQEQVSPLRVQQLLAQVPVWRARGLSVFAFRPPSTPAMEALEDELSQLNYKDLVHDLTAASAIWIETHSGPYRSYDGSHLDAASAERFSEELGGRIHEVLINPLAPSDPDTILQNAPILHQEKQEN